ncbi:histidine kinase-like ATPase [Umbelopsis sp. PMI_123]|nr:histidine kinase-like ATPase [Umbelopsis sp. PMI_123]
MLRIDSREARYRNSQLERAKRLAEESDKKKSLLLSNVSHEVRTPLHGISGVISLLLDTDLSNEQTQMLQEASQATKTLTSIINDLLDFSEIERGHIKLQNSPFNFESALTDVTHAFASRFKEKNLGLFVKFDPSLPKWAIGDSNRIKQILRNFISNACKYTSEGHVSVNSSLVKVDTNGKIYVKIGVTDTGIGIPYDRQKLVFEKFVLGDDSLNRNNGGIGLGLAVSYTLAHMMGGEVGLESKPCVGSEFYLVIPLEPVDQHPDGKEQPTVDLDKMESQSDKTEPPIPIQSVQGLPIHSNDDILSTLSSPTDAISPCQVMEASVVESILSKYEDSQRPFRVLCVEDNKLNQALICRMMQKLEYVYEVADNGQEAIEIYISANTTKTTSQKDSFDVILMDLQMPVCDGFEATRRILDYQKHTFGAAVVPAPIIAVTAQAMSGDREVCLSKGMKGYVSKPIDFQLLRQLLEGVRCQKLLAENESPILVQ